MDPATKARAFEPFFTTKEKGKGTGLGLSTVYGVVKQSGGYIDIMSAPGAGATFQIYLPAVADTMKSEESSAQSARSFNGRETILLVEDEGSLRTLTRNTLELSGYRVLEAKDGFDALKVSDQYDGAINLLLTDVVMPGMGGRALAQELTRRRPDTQTVFMSGYTGQTIGEQGPIDPGSAFLAKPFTRESLTRKVRETLDRRVPVGAK
jgi:CheY-like chemotaxis protein